MNSNHFELPCGSIVDYDTGEIINRSMVDVNERQAEFARSLEELYEICSNSKWDKLQSQSVQVDPRFVEIFRDTQEPVVVQQVVKLAYRIQRRNVWHTNSTELTEALGVSPKNVSRKLRQLAKTKLIRFVKPQGVRRPETNILFDPMLFWSGDWKFRRKASFDWRSNSISTIQRAS